MDSVPQGTVRLAPVEFIVPTMDRSYEIEIHPFVPNEDWGPPNDGLHKGMMIDAIEHQERMRRLLLPDRPRYDIFDSIEHRERTQRLPPPNQPRYEWLE